MQRLIRGIDRVSVLGGYVAAACILLMTLLILVETFVRMVAGSSIFIAEEYSGYLMANFVMMGLAYTLRKGGHINVNLLISKLGPKPTAWFRLSACLLGILAFSILTFELFGLAAENYEFGQESMNITKTPIFIPQIGIVIGSGLMVLQFLAEGLREAMTLSDRPIDTDAD